jgi:pyruvate kinase
VENQEGLVNFDDILHETDGVMVARGDLGMEIPTEKIFLAQKMMIYKCNSAGKPVVTATQMLESMIKSPRPTRAEATDVANAVLDGTDCVMLSGETANGLYPDTAVAVMSRICQEAEASLDYAAIFKELMKSVPLPMSPLESLASSAVRTANKVRATLIIVLTRGGTTAKLVAKYRPYVPILSVAVPVLTTDSLTWVVSEESPAHHGLVYRYPLFFISVIGHTIGFKVTKINFQVTRLVCCYGKCVVCFRFSWCFVWKSHKHMKWIILFFFF